jgi:hypothetical protein
LLYGIKCLVDDLELDFTQSVFPRYYL